MNAAQEDPNMEKLLTPPEVAEALGVPLQTLYNWRMGGEGPPAMRVGRHLRYRPSELEKWLDSRTSGSAA